MEGWSGRRYLCWVGQVELERIVLPHGVHGQVREGADTAGEGAGEVVDQAARAGSQGGRHLPAFSAVPFHKLDRPSISITPGVATSVFKV